MNESMQRNLTIAERCDLGMPVSYDEVWEAVEADYLSQLQRLPQGCYPDWLQDECVEIRDEVIDCIVEGYEHLCGLSPSTKGRS